MKPTNETYTHWNINHPEASREYPAEQNEKRWKSGPPKFNSEFTPMAFGKAGRDLTSWPPIIGLVTFPTNQPLSSGHVFTCLIGIPTFHGWSTGAPMVQVPPWEIKP